MNPSFGLKIKTNKSLHLLISAAIANASISLLLNNSTSTMKELPVYGDINSEMKNNLELKVAKYVTLTRLYSLINLLYMQKEKMLHLHI